MRREFETMERLAEELRQPAQRWWVAADRALLALLEGRFDDAEFLIPEALEIGEHAEAWNASFSYRLQLYLLRREQGRLDELAELYRTDPAEYSDYPVWRCARAHFHAEVGDEGEAYALFESLAENGFDGLPVNEEWLFAMCLLAELACSLGTVDPAARLYELLAPHHSLTAFGDPEIALGVTDRYLGILAAVLDRPDQSAEHFERALTLNGAMGARPWVAHTQRDYAEFLRRRDASGDRERADELIAAALATADELGMTSLAAKAAALG